MNCYKVEEMYFDVDFIALSLILVCCSGLYCRELWSELMFKCYLSIPLYVESGLDHPLYMFPSCVLSSVLFSHVMLLSTGAVVFIMGL